jgi:chromosome segregation ATPase
MIVAGLALASAACAPPQKSVVDQYFRAIQANDNQTLTSFAVVNFDRPVDSWKIILSGEENRSPATLLGLAKQAKELEAELAANKKEYNAYFLDHPTEVEEVRELKKQEDAKIPSKLQQVADDWERFSQKEKELKSGRAELKASVAKEKKNVTLSVGQIENIETLPGEMITKDIELEITIEGQPEGYVMTLRRYELETEQTGRRIMSRWVIYDLQPQA